MKSTVLFVLGSCFGWFLYSALISYLERIFDYRPPMLVAGACVIVATLVAIYL